MSAAVPFRLDRGMNHDVARTVGSIRERDWVLLFRVPMPEGGIRRMEVRGSKLHGRFGNRWDCEKALDTIREDCLRGALRHSFCTHAAARQVESFALQAFMGHASPVTTQKYIGGFEEVELAEVMRPGGPGAKVLGPKK